MSLGMESTSSEMIIERAGGEDRAEIGGECREERRGAP